MKAKNKHCCVLIASIPLLGGEFDTFEDHYFCCVVFTCLVFVFAGARGTIEKTCNTYIKFSTLFGLQIILVLRDPY